MDQAGLVFLTPPPVSPLASVTYHYLYLSVSNCLFEFDWFSTDFVPSVFSIFVSKELFVDLFVYALSLSVLLLWGQLFLVSVRLHMSLFIFFRVFF